MIIAVTHTIRNIMTLNAIGGNVRSALQLTGSAMFFVATRRENDNFYFTERFLFSYFVFLFLLKFLVRARTR